MDSHVIAKNAMELWQLMNDGTVWCYKKLKELSRLSDREIDFALGWLIREDSLEIKADPLTRRTPTRSAISGRLPGIDFNCWCRLKMSKTTIAYAISVDY